MPGGIEAAVVGIAFLVGVGLYARFGGATSTAADAIALIGKLGWIVAGIMLVVGGFVILGMILVILGVAIGLGRADRISDRDLRSELNG